MTQHINLYTRLPKEEEVRHMVSDGLLRTLGMVAIGGFVLLFLMQVIKLTVANRTLSVLTQEQETLQATLTTLEAQYPEETKLLIEEQGERIQGEIDSKTEMLQAMKTQLNDIPGFSKPLEALAKQISTGVWLTQIEIDHQEKTYRFHGNAFQVDQVLAFISNLGKDEFFADKNFKVFEVLQSSSEEGYISFILATE